MLPLKVMIVDIGRTVKFSFYFGIVTTSARLLARFYRTNETTYFKAHVQSSLVFILWLVKITDKQNNKRRIMITSKL